MRRAAFVLALLTLAACGGAMAEGLLFQKLDKERCDAAIKAVVEQTGAKKKGNVEQWDNLYRIFIEPEPPIENVSAFISCVGATPPEFSSEWSGEGRPPEEWLAFVAHAGGALTGRPFAKIADMASSCLRANDSNPVPNNVTEDGLLLYCRSAGTGLNIFVEKDVQASDYYGTGNARAGLLAPSLPDYPIRDENDRVAYDALATSWDSESPKVKQCALGRMERYHITRKYLNLLEALNSCLQEELDAE